MAHEKAGEGAADDHSEWHCGHEISAEACPLPVRKPVSRANDRAGEEPPFRNSSGPPASAHLIALVYQTHGRQTGGRGRYRIIKSADQYALLREAASCV